jgi:lysophospholipase L1-like esterase
VLRDAIDPVFRVLNRGALVPSPIGSYSDQSGPLALAPNPTGATEVKNPWWLSFQHYGTKFAAHLSGKNNTFRLWTNGSPSTAAGQILTTDFNKHYVLFDWGGSPQWRDLMLEFSPGTTLDASTLIGGLIIEPTATLGPPIRHSPVKGAVLGDSLGEGRDADDRSRGYVQRTFRLLGYDDVVSVSLGGTGVLTDGGNAGGKYIERAPALYAFVPDIVVVQASVNDGTPNGAGGLVQPAATTLLNDIKSNLPNAYIFVLGILYANDFTAQYLAVHNEWKAACATVGVTFIDTQNPLLSWGSGRVGATTGDGPADLFANTGASNPHPSQAGHDNNANRAAPLIGAGLSAPIG